MRDHAFPLSDLSSEDTGEIVAPSEKGADCGGVIFPWEDVNRCLDKKIPALSNHLSCPICGKASEGLVWINFNSPEWTWNNYCGRYGPLSICVGPIIR